MSFDAVVTACKDIGIFTGAATLLWRIFIFLKAATDTVRAATVTAKAIPGFMTSTSEGLNNMQVYMQKAVDNHLNHIESGIATVASSTSKTAEGMERLQNDFRDYILEDTKTQAIILERLPQL